MKIFIASFLLLASASSVSIADNHLDTLVIASSPQQCSDLNRTACKFQPDVKVAYANTKSQFEWIGANLTNTLGVVVNGDLTKVGTPYERELSNDLFAILDKANVPYYFGIGANDLTKGCAEEICAIGGVMHLVKHVNALKTKSAENGRTVNFDFTQVDGYNRNLTLSTDVIGSLGYAVDMGKVFYIQLNNNDLQQDEVVNRYVSGFLELSPAEYKVQINPILNWLETTLEFAAQQGKVIVVNKYDANADTGINALLDKYDVRLRFSGQPAINPAQSKFVSAGFSFEKDFLKLDLNYDQKTYQIVRVKNLDLNQKTVVTSGQFIAHPTFYPAGQLPARNTIISIKNQGAYVGKASVSYDDANNDKQVINIPDMALGNVFIANIPKGARSINTSLGAMWSTKSAFELNNLERFHAPVFCFTTGGVVWAPWYSPNIDEVVPMPYFNTQTKC